MAPFLINNATISLFVGLWYTALGSNVPCINRTGGDGPINPH